MPIPDRVHCGLAALLLLLHLASPLGAGAELLATAPYQECVNTSCIERLEARVGVSYGLRQIFDTAYGIAEPYEAPVRFEVSKSEPGWVYPLRYLHSVDYAPREELIKVVNRRPGISDCVDGAAAVAPTCGWQLDSAGEKIPASQGFCSNRDLLQLKSCAPGQEPWRGETELGGQSTLADSFAIAHCLRESGVRYRGYAIDLPRRDYAVSVRVFTPAPVPETDPPTGEVTLSAFTLTPATPIYRDTTLAHPLLATLEPEFQPPPAEDLSGLILYLPEALVGGRPDWDRALLVPRALVSLDGGDCDRVGVSYAAFRAQGAAAATSVAGACLANQLKQLDDSDQARLAADPAAETRFLLRGMKRFKGELAALDSLALRLKSPQQSFSPLTLRLDPAVLAAETVEAAAYIDTASGDPFPSQSGAGRLQIKVVNIGVNRADYLVTVTNCTPAINPLPPQARTIAPGQRAPFEFPLTVNQNLATSHFCDVELLAPSGRKYDQVKVTFDTTAWSDRAAPALHLVNRDTTTAP